MKVGIRCKWVVKEKRGGIYVPVLERYNSFTNDGLTQLASAIQGGYVPPINLVIDNGGTTMHATANIGASSIQLEAQVELPGDTQLVLSAGLANQEVVTFSGPPTGTGPFTYSLTAALTKAHIINELVARQINQNDTMTSVTSEVEYDPAGAPGQRVQSSVGFSGGTGMWTIQFYIPGGQALTTFTYLGLSDSNTIGQGLLHSHLVNGYVHNAGFDVEVDGNLSLENI